MRLQETGLGYDHNAIFYADEGVGKLRQRVIVAQRKLDLFTNEVRLRLAEDPIELNERRNYAPRPSEIGDAVFKFVTVENGTAYYDFIRID